MEPPLRDSLRARPVRGTHTDRAIQGHPMALASLARHTAPLAPGIHTAPHAQEIHMDRARQALLTAPALPAAPTVPRALRTHTVLRALGILTAPHAPEILTVHRAPKTHMAPQAPEILTVPRLAAGAALTEEIQSSKTRVFLATEDHHRPDMVDNHPVMVPAETLTDQDLPHTVLAPSSQA